MVVRTFFILVLGCLIGTACVERKQNNTFELSEIDSVESDTILLAPEKALQPDANDGLFDDFLFEFLRNPNFQKNRVKYPLPINEDVVDRGFSISENWGFNESSTSAMLFTSADALTLAKDTSLNDVIVDVLCLQTDSIRQFVFHRFAQRWWLQKINIPRWECRQPQRSGSEPRWKAQPQPRPRSPRAEALRQRPKPPAH